MSKRIGHAGAFGSELAKCSVFPRTRQLRCTSGDVLLLDWVTASDSSDEAGRRKIKKNYEELLGIRIEKLKGRVLNREKINKSIDGLYFICFECKKICHNLDEGWVEEAATQNNFCGTCAKAKGIRSAAA